MSRRPVDPNKIESAKAAAERTRAEFDRLRTQQDALVAKNRPLTRQARQDLKAAQKAGDTQAARRAQSVIDQAAKSEKDMEKKVAAARTPARKAKKYYERLLH